MEIKWNITALRTRGAFPLLESLRLHVGRLQVFIKYYKEGQLRLVNSALTSLTEARAAGAPLPNHPPLVLNNAAALWMGHLLAYFLSSSFLCCHFFLKHLKLQRLKGSGRWPRVEQAPSAAQWTVAAPGGLQGKLPGTPRGHCLGLMPVVGGRARERARSNLHMNTDGQG